MSWIACALVGAALVWLGGGRLESSASRLAGHYGLPEIVQGAVIVAIGSSFPELATVVVSTIVHGEFELGVAAIVGSALFNILVIPALSGLLSGRSLPTSRDLVYKEAQFYMVAVTALLLTFSFAIIYRPVTDGGPGMRGELTRTMALLPLLVYAVYIFAQWQDTVDHEPEDDGRTIRPGREWARLVVGLVLIVAGVEALVRSAIGFGELLGTPSFLWGITVVAIGTSIPDAVVSIRAARKDRPLASTANVLGSNVFDLLCCIPIGILIAGAAVVNFSVAAPLMAVLTLATVALFVTMRTGLVITRVEAWSLLGTYVLFVAWMTAESFGVVDLIVDFPPGR